MEIEYKWDLPDSETLDNLLESLASKVELEQPRELHMRATYYDTETGDIAAMRGGLRIRQENDRSVCCLKLAVEGEGACKERREYEVEAQDICEGLAGLPSAGAPHDVCEHLLAAGPRPTCETDFMRRAYTLYGEGFTAELAVDMGEMRNDDRSAPIAELELEHVEGSLESFHAFAQQLQEEFVLRTQPLSKLARASAL